MTDKTVVVPMDWIQKALYCLRHGDTESVENYLLAAAPPQNSADTKAAGQTTTSKCTIGVNDGYVSAAPNDAEAAPMLTDEEIEIWRETLMEFMDNETDKLCAQAKLASRFSVEPAAWGIFFKNELIIPSMNEVNAKTYAKQLISTWGNDFDLRTLHAKLPEGGK